MANFRWKMRVWDLITGVACIGLGGLVGLPIGQAEEVSRIAFGSCAEQDRPQPIWDAVVGSNPDLFVFLGDNIYGDTTDMEVMARKYRELAEKPGYQALKKTARIEAIWDDHDYGENDAGREYPKREESAELLLDFFDVPEDSPRRRREGIYGAKTYGPSERRVQLILLDTRYFRSPLTRNGAQAEPGEGVHGPYAANPDPSATLLGEAQWQWLEKQLRKPARLRVIASSIQVIANGHHWEKWGNFPLERERLFSLIELTEANGVILLSGDRHRSEISRLPSGLGYPVYDLTSSSLNQPQPFRNERNRHRVGLIYPKSNFGMIQIDWEESDPTVRMQIRDVEGEVMLQVRSPLSRLQPE